MIKNILNLLSGLRDYSRAVVPNLVVKRTIVSGDTYAGSRPWKGIVIHHSATVDGKASDWEGIRKYHTSYRIDGNIVTEEQFRQRQLMGSGKAFEKPWSDIGYHGGWELVGNLFQFRIGRNWGSPGAHAGLKGRPEFNNDYLGLCVVGNFDKAAPAPELWSLCLSTVREIIQRFVIPPNMVIGHREVYDIAGVPRQKTCPGTMFDIARFRREL